MSATIVCDEFQGHWAEGVARFILCGVTLIIGAALISKFCRALDAKTHEKYAVNIANTSSLSTLEETAKIEKNLKIVAIIAIVGCMIAAIFYCLFFIIATIDCDNIAAISMILIVELTFTGVLNVSLFIIFVFRLVYCFQDTTYAASKFVKLWYFSWTGIIILMIIISFCFVIFIDDFKGVSISVTILSTALVCYLHNVPFVNSCFDGLTLMVCQL